LRSFYLTDAQIAGLAERASDLRRSSRVEVLPS
jgi:hypothetical protein